MQVRYKQFKNYSGPVIYGKLHLPEFSDISHCGRAVILTEAVETGYRIGSIMAADGTGVTAGRGQHILVYPRELANEDFNPLNDQGGLGQLLQFLDVQAPSKELRHLFEKFKKEGWYLASDGKFRWLENTRIEVKGRWVDCKPGSVVHGAVLRDVVTPVGGRVPKKGERWDKAREWAVAFHKVFANPSSFQAQTDFEIGHLVDRICKRKFDFRAGHRKETILQVVYGGIALSCGDDLGMSEELDLAMCVFHAHTVNAPSIAFRKLRDALRVVRFDASKDRGTTVEPAFARELLKQLAQTDYGRWNENINGGRWARTRSCARKMGVWHPEFFKGQWAIMPLSF